MRRIREALLCGLLASLIVCAIYGILLLRAATATVAAVPGEIATTRGALAGQLSRVLDGDPETVNPEDRLSLRAVVLKRVDGIRKDLLDPDTGQMAVFQENLDNQITGLRADLFDPEKGQVSALRKDTLARVDAALADLKPVLKNTAVLVADTDKTVNDLRPQLLGLVAASKVTAGESATTMREIQRATPEILASVKDATAHIDAATGASAEASANAAKVTGNLAAATKPLPRAVRVGLQIGGPVAQITSYVILMLSTMGIL
jgi:hypothetical protein